MDDKLIAGGETIYLPHKEVITLRGVVPGRYTYAIHLYRSRDPSHGGKRDPRALGISVHAEVVKLNPKVVTEFRRDFTLNYEGDAVDIWSMDVSPDGNFVEVDPPVEPIVVKFYRTASEKEEPRSVVSAP
jgi:hypothetical protein